MWEPKLELQPSLPFSSLIVLLHSLAAGVVLWLPSPAWLLLPVVLLAMAFNLGKYGLRRFPRSIVGLWLDETGWHAQLKNGETMGPFGLAASSRVDGRFIRLSLRRSSWRALHVIITPRMIGEDQFRRLQVFLRWSAEKQISGGNEMAVRQSNV